MSKIGIKKSKYKEMNNIAELNFMYSKADDLIEEVRDISSNLHYLPFKYSLAGSSLFDDFDEDKIKELLDEMTPDRAIILLSS